MGKDFVNAKACFFAAIASAIISSACANPSLSTLFGDHAVLQRDKPIPVWGFAAAGERLTVRFKGQVITTNADSEGRWKVAFDAIPASLESADLTVEGLSTVTVRDILIGEVWIAGGQSNMEVPVSESKDAAREIAESHYPLVRHFKVAKKIALEPEERVTGEWRIADPTATGDFTAVGFYFARQLYRDLAIPIGILNATYGGTPIEPWLSLDALKRDSAFSVVADRWNFILRTYPKRLAEYQLAFKEWENRRDRAQSRHETWSVAAPPPPVGPGAPSTPSALFNGMINPLVPYAIRGVIWYQGESNRGRPEEYHRLFASLITDWRGHFGQGDFPFYWVQLANFNASGAENVEYALVREAQTQTLSSPSTGQAIAVEIGEPTNIHPRNKQEVARRLALIARSQTYGHGGEYSGPMLKEVTRIGSEFRLSFSHAEGLHSSSGPLQGFEIAGKDKLFVPAPARIEGNTVLVDAQTIKEAVAVRYAFHNAPVGNLYNSADLPACPFRSDTW